MKKTYVLGMDVGGTNLRLGLIDKDYGLTAFERMGTQDIFVADCDVVGIFIRCIREYCDRHLAGQLPDAVSIGFPSTINRQRTIVLQTPNILCIPDNFAVVQELEQRLGIRVFINRDVNFLLLFDLEDLKVPQQDCVTGIYFGTGIGNAIFMHGRLLLGRNGAAAELGHLPVYGNKRICNCGNESCLETLVSGVALETLQAERFPGTAINRMFVEQANTPEIAEFLAGMGQAVATEVNLLDPDCVILGGGLLQMAGFPKEKLEAAVHHFSRKPYPEQNLDIRYSSANQENGVIGAGIYAFKRMQDPSYL